MIGDSIRAEYIGMRNDRLGDSRGVRWLGGGLGFREGASSPP